MKKRYATMLLASLFSLLATVAQAQARMVPMNDQSLHETIGQAGIAVAFRELGFDLDADTIYYRDGDGLGAGTGTTAGYLSLCGVDLKGSATFAKPMRVEVMVEKDAKGRTEVKGLQMSMTEMTLKVDRFYVDAIRLGSSAGTGGSLGSLGIDNMTLRMTGAFTLSAY